MSEASIAMPIDFPGKRKKRKFLGPWLLLNVACGLALIVAVVALNRYGVAEFIGRLEGNTNSGKREPGAANLPKIVRPGSDTDSAADGSKLPTIIRLGPNSAAPTGVTAVQPKRIDVIDGDTIRADGHSYRLAGIDTPESGPRAKCAAEREKAARASKRLREIVAGGGLSINRVSCYCAPGTEGTDACNYGRLCGLLTSNGRDVGKILIGEGLAKSYDCSSGHCPPKQNWCG